MYTHICVRVSAAGKRQPRLPPAPEPPNVPEREVFVVPDVPNVPEPVPPKAVAKDAASDVPEPVPPKAVPKDAVSDVPVLPKSVLKAAAPEPELLESIDDIMKHIDSVMKHIDSSGASATIKK